MIPAKLNVNVNDNGSQGKTLLLQEVMANNVFSWYFSKNK